MEVSTPNEKNFMMENFIPKNESQHQISVASTNNINNINNKSPDNDLANEVIYFSINQDSKLVKIIFIFIL